jgi:hypothetical protein
VSVSETFDLAVANTNDTPTGEVTITGTPATEDQPLTMDASSIRDDDGLGTFSYQWQHLETGVDTNGDGLVGWANITGATTSTYTPGDADVGAQRRGIVSYTDGRGWRESVTSAATDPVANVNDAPAIGGNLAFTVSEGGTVLLGTAGLTELDPDDDGDGLTYTVTAQTNGSVLVSGAAAATFTQADLAAGRVSFRHDGSETTAASFSVSLADGGENGAAPATATVNLTVNPVNDAPTAITPSATSVSVAENSLSTGITLAVADVDGGNLNWSFGGTDGALFTVDTSSGTPTLKFAAALDYEDPTHFGVDNQFHITVTATDGTAGSVTTEMLAVTVTDVDGVTYLGGTGIDVIPDTSTTPTTRPVTDEEDTIRGNGGRDVLSGSGGNDLISGGVLDDILTGGAGRDTFLYEAWAEGHRLERITDFTSGQDKFGIVSTGFNDIVAISVEGLSGTVNYVDNGFVYDGSTGTLYFNDVPTGSTDDFLVAIARLDNDADATNGGIVPTLTVNDFQII